MSSFTGEAEKDAKGTEMEGKKDDFMQVNRKGILRRKQRCQGTWISMHSDQGLRSRSWTGQIQVSRGCGAGHLEWCVSVCWGVGFPWCVWFRVEITLEPPRVRGRWGEDMLCANVQWLSLKGVGGPEGWVGQVTERVGGKGTEDWKHGQ